MDVVFSTSHAVLDEAKGIVQSIKQTKQLQEELQRELSLTQSMVNNLENLVKRIKGGDGSDPFDPIASVVRSGGIQLLLEPDDVNHEVQSLQKAIEEVRTQLDAIKNMPKKSRLRGKFGQAVHPERGKDKVEALLNHLRVIRTSVEWLYREIPM